MDTNILLYDGTKKIPEIFSQNDVALCIKTIMTSKDYPENAWGDWEKMRDRAIFATIYFLALRPNEACSLKFSDFDIQRGVIKIDGNNNKTKKDRELPIPQQLMHFYSEYFAFNRTYFWKGSEYLFPSQQNNHISSARWKMIMREKILKPAKLYYKGKTRSYTLRHTRATELLNRTKDIFMVANILGHSKLDSTKVYLHKSESYMDYMRTMINETPLPKSNKKAVEARN